MRKSPYWIVFLALMAGIDLYFFQAVQVVAEPVAPATRVIIYSLYWAVSVAAMALFWLLPYIHFKHHAKLARSTIFSVLAGLFFAKFFGSVVFLADDVSRVVQLLGGESVERSYALSWAGIAAGGLLFGVLVYGFGNKYKYQVKKVRLNYDNLPASFHGLKIVHISDIHSGSFTNKEAVLKGVEQIMASQPDLILFTGDLVNNVADEMRDYMDVFSQLKAPLGVYSILGNHDYGDYVQWPDVQAKTNNMENLKSNHEKIGWKLLLNEHQVIQIKGHPVSIIGVENFSASRRFSKYGNLAKAYDGVPAQSLQFLLSHDPSHWDHEVNSRYPDISLTCSGHTHGFQFGVEIPGYFRWSPSQYVYNQWAGLYRKGKQFLYVNRGFGFLGYPGRVGILPEITLLELTAAV